MRKRSAPALLALFAFVTLFAFGNGAQAQPSRSASGDAANQIVADSGAYHIEWNGQSGVFMRRAFGQQAEVRQPLQYLHTDAGPAGYASHLAWFLARAENSFSILWCYLNDSGSKFDCWLYRYPDNQLVSLHFTGVYRYTQPKEPTAAGPAVAFKTDNLPGYVGPDFSYRDWTRQIGALATLELKPVRRSDTAATAPVRSLSQLRVRPLHQVEVGAANGWREGGWSELHAIAFDAAEDPYYLILYSNTTNGYVVDLKRSQIYTADFGARVAFQKPAAQGFGPTDNPLNIAPQTKVRPFERFEITLNSSETIANPYVDAQVGIEFRGPDAKPVVVPAFWDGGGTFRVRFAPRLTGIWTWRSLSRIEDLNAKSGAFECINVQPAVRGFVEVQPNYRNQRHFAYSDGTPFLPISVREPAPDFVAPGGASAVGSPGGATKVALREPQSSGAIFIAFQRFVNAAAEKGFSRLVGGFLFSPDSSGMVRANEGGPMCTSEGIEHINPAFFQAMDRRLAYCNARGIVPDIGIGTLDNSLFSNYKPEALYRLWAYVVSRYAAFDVHWNLFERGNGLLTGSTQKSAQQFAELTRLIDPNRHPVIFSAPGIIAAPASALGDAGTLQDGVNGDPAPQRAPARKKVNTPPPPVPYDQPWIDVIGVLGGDLAQLPTYSQVTKPVALIDKAGDGEENTISAEAARSRMWQARLRGVYVTPAAVPVSADATALAGPEFQAAAVCGTVFGKTQFWRLAPHPELLGGPGESSAAQRRRRKAEAALKRPKPAVTDAGSESPDETPDNNANGDDAPQPTAPKVRPVFVAADPSREYLLYFAQGGDALLDLLEAIGKIEATWINPRTGEAMAPIPLKGGAYQLFTAPDEHDWVLYIKRS